MLWRVALSVLLFVECESRWKNAGWQMTQLRLSPVQAKPCMPTEITVEFQLGDGSSMTAGDVVTVVMGGYTSGSCDNRAGNDMTYDQLLFWPEEVWRVNWYEGTVVAEFRDSYLTMTALVDIDTPFAHVVILDPANGIKPNCGMSPDNPEIQISGVIANDTSVVPYEPFNATDPVNGSCYLTSTALDFSPPLPKKIADIELSFTPAMRLRQGHKVVLRLAGWTSGNATGKAGANIAELAMREDGSELNVSAIFAASFEEGCCYEAHKPGFETSEIVLTVREGAEVLPGTALTLVILKSNGLKAQCGMEASYDSTTLQVNASNNATGTNPMHIETQSAVGDGCSTLSFCNGKGACDHCRQRCDCLDLYSSSLTCDIPVCPKGRSWAQPPQQSGLAHVDFAVCSDAGLCGTTGKCKCFPNFEGGACERRKCPGFVAGVGDCSGRGECSSMRALSRIPGALPLSLRSSQISALPYQYGNALAEEPSAEWDADRIFGCVCDSTWSVGLGDGQTQEPEWFGADCSLSHCPTGDDPMTRKDDTNCTNVTATNGRGVGLWGNLCHVDCSNRGICDYALGTCTCFNGFEGPNCGRVNVLAIPDPDDEKNK